MSRDTSHTHTDLSANEEATNCFVRVRLIPPDCWRSQVPTLPCQGMEADTSGA